VRKRPFLLGYILLLFGDRDGGGDFNDSKKGGLLQYILFLFHTAQKRLKCRSERGKFFQGLVEERDISNSAGLIEERDRKGI
jgi:hypothetical protein